MRSEIWRAVLSLFLIPLGAPSDETTVLLSIHGLTSGDALRKELASCGNTTHLLVTDSNITQLDATVFGVCSDLRRLTVTGNVIDDISGSLPSSLHRLDVVNLSSNSLQNVNSDLFESLTGPVRVDLSNNRLKRLENLGENVRTLDISGNWTRCSSSLLWLLDIYTKTPSRLVNTQQTRCVEHISNIIVVEYNFFDILYFQQATVNQCPSDHCECIMKPTKDFYVTQLTCVRQGLETVNFTLPNTTAVLDLSNNKLTDLSWLEQQNLLNLTRLVLSDNNIREVSGLLKSKLPHLHYLDLKNNKLSMFLREVAVSIVHPGMESLYLSGNPWTCSCENVQTLSYFIGEHFTLVKDRESIACGEYGTYRILYWNTWSDDLKCVSNVPTIYIVGLTVEVALFLTLAARFWWDCRNYRRTGKVPDFVMKYF